MLFVVNNNNNNNNNIIHLYSVFSQWSKGKWQMCIFPALLLSACPFPEFDRIHIYLAFGIFYINLVILTGHNHPLLICFVELYSTFSSAHLSFFLSICICTTVKQNSQDSFKRLYISFAKISEDHYKGLQKKYNYTSKQQYSSSVLTNSAR